MSAEIELKLLVNQEFATFLSKEMASFNVLSHTQQILGNCYYDTPDDFFSSRRMGLRVRTINEQFILTLKTDGEVIGGLHMRPEYDVELDSAVPRLQGLSRFGDLQLARPLAELQAELKPIFSTDFLRQAWVIELGNGANIEVALDQGEIEANDRIEPICEVEFELKHGSVDDLLTFVEQLSLSDGIRLGAVNKAKRGYQLAGVLPLQPFDWQAEWQNLPLADPSPSAVLTALLAYEQRLTDYYAELLTGGELSAEIVDSGLAAFAALYAYYDQHQALLWQAYERVPSKVRLDDESINEFIELNQRVLAKVNELQRSAHTPNRTLYCYELLHRGNGVKRQLHLIKLTLNA
ncbi:CYTH domain-containing protein [Testudinibacter sp. P80/BLE/0925]|uniref:CYTH domain-containing protein n=1 Tax=Testudinibacter sp. TW-1 TaxID=3417757 RepID=UPI003D360D32